MQAQSAMSVAGANSREIALVQKLRMTYVAMISLVVAGFIAVFVVGLGGWTFWSEEFFALVIGIMGLCAVHLRRQDLVMVSWICCLCNIIWMGIMVILVVWSFVTLLSYLDFEVPTLFYVVLALHVVYWCAMIALNSLAVIWGRQLHAELQPVGGMVTQMGAPVGVVLKQDGFVKEVNEVQSADLA